MRNLLTNTLEAQDETKMGLCIYVHDNLTSLETVNA